FKRIPNDNSKVLASSSGEPSGEPSHVHAESEHDYSQLLHNVQEKLSHVFDTIKVIAPSVSDEIEDEDDIDSLPFPDSMQQEPDEQPSFDDVVVEDDTDGTSKHRHSEGEPVPLIPIHQPRRGDVVFEDNTDGTHKYRHFEGEPIPMEPKQNQPIDIELEKPHPENGRFTKILEYMRGFKQILPADWDDEYLDEPAESEGNESDGEDQDDDVETEIEGDKILEKEDDYRGNVFTNILGHLPIAKSNKRICHSQQELEEAVLLTIEKVIQAKAADKAKLARLIFGQPKNKENGAKHHSSSQQEKRQESELESHDRDSQLKEDLFEIE
ncbi:hypothetical protein BGZ76_002602, partial [Entomortierella beljakovae]